MFRSATYSALRLVLRRSTQTDCHRASAQCQTIRPVVSAVRLFSANAQPKAQQYKDTEQFTGVIPLDEIKFSYCKSSGAGGQHVNKVNTKVEIRFHLDSASWIPEALRLKLKEAERGRITKSGELLVTSEKTRVQMLNKADALDKLRDMIFKAAVEPEGPSEEDIMKRQKRHDKAVKERLQQKRIHSLKKQSRQAPSAQDF